MTSTLTGILFFCSPFFPSAYGSSLLTPKDLEETVRGADHIFVGTFKFASGSSVWRYKFLVREMLKGGELPQTFSLLDTIDNEPRPTERLKVQRDWIVFVKRISSTEKIGFCGFGILESSPSNIKLIRSAIDGLEDERKIQAGSAENRAQ